LVIDLDDQANASLSLGVNRADELDQAADLDAFQKILNSFKERAELIDFLCDCDSSGFGFERYVKPSQLNTDLGKTKSCKGIVDVIPGSYRTQDAAIRDLVDPQRLLDTALEKSGVAQHYDYIIIDTPPSSTDMTKNGLFAAQYLVIPTQLEYLSAFGVTARLELVRTINSRSRNKRSILLGIVPMMVNTKITKTPQLHQIIRGLLERQIEDIPILSEIHDSQYVKNASYERKPVLLVSKSKKAKEAAAEFSNLTDELLDRIKAIETEKGEENG
jgi:chromosome partitioning protein